MPVDHDTAFSEFLVQERARRGWSQEELSRYAGVGSVVISRIERGVTKNPNKSTVKALLDALQVYDDRGMPHPDDVDEMLRKDQLVFAELRRVYPTLTKLVDNGELSETNANKMVLSILRGPQPHGNEERDD